MRVGKANPNQRRRNKRSDVWVYYALFSIHCQIAIQNVPVLAVGWPKTLEWQKCGNKLELRFQWAPKDFGNFVHTLFSLPECFYPDSQHSFFSSFHLHLLRRATYKSNLCFTSHLSLYHYPASSPSELFEVLYLKLFCFLLPVFPLHRNHLCEGRAIFSVLFIIISSILLK